LAEIDKVKQQQTAPKKISKIGKEHPGNRTMKTVTHKDLMD
jgi:hypothetical protein